MQEFNYDRETINYILENHVDRGLVMAGDLSLEQVRQWDAYKATQAAARVYKGDYELPETPHDNYLNLDDDNI